MSDNHESLQLEVAALRKRRKERLVHEQSSDVNVKIKVNYFFFCYFFFVFLVHFLPFRCYTSTIHYFILYVKWKNIFLAAFYSFVPSSA